MYHILQGKYHKSDSTIQHTQKPQKIERQE